MFPLPPEVGEARLTARLAEIVAREDVLQTTELPEDGKGAATYSGDSDLPVVHGAADSLEHFDEQVAELQAMLFPKRGGLLWKLVVIEHPDAAGRSARTVCALFDRLITDERSLHLFVNDVLRDGREASTRTGRYRAWVEWQLREYPMAEAAEAKTPTRDFWRRYFDDGSPTRAVELPFCNPAVSPSELHHVLHRKLPASAQALQSTAARLQTTPFLVFLASVVSAIGSLTAAEDLTVRFMTHGRVSPFLHTLGWFSSHLPLRIRHSSLANPQAALEAATAARLEILRFETTPWEYVLEVCGEADAETPQVVINFGPYGPDGQSRDLPRDGTSVGWPRGFLNVSVFPAHGRVTCSFDPGRFEALGVDDFVALVFERLRRLVAT